MYVLQDWTSIFGTDTNPTVQSVKDWFDLSRFGGATFWLEVRTASNPGAGNIILSYETAPARDESLFEALATVTLSASATPVVTKVLLSANPAVPLARYLRWKVVGTATGAWSTTFRILVMPNRGIEGGSFDPSKLPLTGWWRNYASMPWAGSASAGTSGSHSLTSSGADPTAGSLNGFGTATYDGSTQSMASSLDPTDLFTASAGTIIALFNAGAANTDTGFWYAESALLSTGPSISEVGLQFSTAGVVAGDYDGTAFNRLAVACGTGAWHLASFTWDGAQMRVRVDSGGFNTQATGALSLTATTMISGVDPNTGSVFYQGQIAELLSADTVLADGDLDNVKSYVNARYGLSL